MTKLSEIGEFGLIRHFSGHFKNNLPEGFTGIGDDCAILPLNNDEALLVTTDMLIEDRHFLSDKISPFELGHKSLAVNLSDIAAMGGSPTGAFLSIGIPPKLDVDWLDEFFRGIRELGERTGTLLLGGDTTKSPDRLVINIAVLGKALTGRIKKRNSAMSGDHICLTGFVGDSAGGLKILLEKKEINCDAEYLIKQHHLPQPHLDEGKWLAAQPEVNAMMDVSDGIASDIRRILESSEKGAEIILENLPLSQSLRRTSEKYGWNTYETAVGGGEDYCLMLTVSGNGFSGIKQAFEKKFGRPLFNIGRITDKTLNLEFKHGGKSVVFSKCGFDHFKNNQ